VWASVTVAHTLILLFYYKLNLSTAFFDSFVFNSLFAVFASGIWYMTRYSDLRKKNAVEIFITHFSTCAISILIWIYAGKLILENSLSSNSEYLLFLKESLFVRGISGSLYYLILSSIFYIIISFRELKEQIARENALNTLLKDAELRMLRAQIRPHFLFNSLNSISSLTLSDPEKAREMIVKLSEFMRFSLDYADEKMIKFNKEMNYERLYLDIEKTRFGNKLQITESIPEKCLNLELPAMILQPLLENAVKYGVYESVNETLIEIKADCSNQKLIIVIINTFEADSVLPKGTGTGLKNIAQRLKYIYGNTNLLKVDKNYEKFKVTIEIPQNE